MTSETDRKERQDCEGGGGAEREGKKRGGVEKREVEMKAARVEIRGQRRVVEQQRRT